MDDHIVKKKPKVGEKSKDMISELPDAMLCHILSFLSTRATVRTRILSRRWVDLWLYVPVFDLQCWERFPDRDAFLSFVNRFLGSCNGHLEKFRLCHYNESFDDYHLHWVNTLLSRKIRDLELTLGPKIPMMPRTLYISPVLTRLRLEFVGLDTPEVVSLPCLKVLYLGMVQYFDDLTIERLISSCVALEDLTFCRLGDGRKSLVTVCSQTLKKLDFEYEPHWFSGDVEDGVLIDSPNLEYLRICDFNSDYITIKGLDPSVSVDICITFNVDYESLPENQNPNDQWKRTIIRKLFTEVSGVNHMKISAETLEVVYYFFKSEPIFQFDNLSSLHLEFSESNFEILAHLLESSMNLKSLVLEWRGISFHKMDNAATLSSVPQCGLRFLELVEIKMPIMKVMKMRSLVKYFLQNLVALKKLTICSYGSMRMRHEIAILKKLLMYRRLSRDCQVFVNHAR